MSRSATGRQARDALVAGARANLLLPMPGYTHLQHAQPITWGHWLLSHFWPLTRDVERFKSARAAAAVLPLGSGALAGTAFPVDRQALAEELGLELAQLNQILIEARTKLFEVREQRIRSAMNHQSGQGSFASPACS